VKDSVVNLLVFLLVFVGAAAFFLGTYALAMGLVPGGRGLVFLSPYAAALFPALLCALLVALYRAFHRPGSFTVTWLFLGAAFLLLLTLSVPVIEGLPPVRTADASPLVPGRFLPLEDDSLLLSDGRASVLIPAEGGDLAVSERTEFDPLNQRFVLSEGGTRALGSSGPERQYFQYTPALVSIQTDFLALYTVLRESAQHDGLLYWAQAGALTWLFLGLYLAFALRTWPLVHGIFMLVLLRIAVWAAVYAFWSVPALVDVWLPGPAGEGLRHWAPVGLVATAAATLFFMTWLSKPHRGRETA